jgi:hypothetical protein
MRLILILLGSVIAMSIDPRSAASADDIKIDDPATVDALTEAKAQIKRSRDGRIISVNLSFKPATDELVARLDGLPALRKLDISYTSVTPNVVNHLKTLPELRELHTYVVSRLAMNTLVPFRALPT